MGKYFAAQVVSLGRITIPSEVREELDIKEGDYVEIHDIRKLPSKKAEEAP